MNRLPHPFVRQIFGIEEGPNERKDQNYYDLECLLCFPMWWVKMMMVKKLYRYWGSLYVMNVQVHVVQYNVIELTPHVCIWENLT
jgi:hypothetical protein